MICGKPNQRWMSSSRPSELRLETVVMKGRGGHSKNILIGVQVDRKVTIVEDFL